MNRAGRLKAETDTINSPYMFKDKMLSFSFDTDFHKPWLSLEKRSDGGFSGNSIAHLKKKVNKTKQNKK